MNIAIFAADRVGRDVVQFFKEESFVPCITVLDDNDPKKFNGEIRKAVTSPLVFGSGELDRPEILEQFRNARLDLIILAWWPYLLRQPLMGIPRLGCLNFHPSLLPHDRGKHPNFWSLVEASPFGVSLHFIDDGIDSGDVAFQRPIAKSWEDTGGTLYETAQREIVDLFRENFPAILRGEIPRKRQDLSHGTMHLGRQLEAASRLDLNKSYVARDLLNLLRARTFPPHPAAYFEEDGHEYEVRVEIRKRK